MSNFVKQLIDRSTGQLPEIQPRVRGIFEGNSDASPAILNNETNRFSAIDQEADYDLLNDRTGNKSFRGGEKQAADSSQTFHISTGNSIDEIPSSDSSINQQPFKDSSVHINLKLRRRQSAPTLVAAFESGEDLAEQAHTMTRFPGKVSFVDSNKEVKEFNDDTSQTGILRIPSTLKESAGMPEILPVNTVYPSPRQPETFISSAKEKTKTLEDQFLNSHAQYIKEEPLMDSQTINVTIGRVEVRVHPPAAHAPAKTKTETEAIMSLDKYLEQRNHGNR